MAPVRRLSAAAVVALLVGLLSGCAAAVSSAGLVGAYHDATGLVELHVQSGGRADAALLDTENGVVTGSGTWRLLGPSSAFGPQRLELDFSHTPDAGVRVVDYAVSDGGRSISYTSQATNATITLQR